MVKKNETIVHVAVIAPQNTEKELKYQNEKKNGAKYIIRLSKEKEKLIQCFERLKPLEIKNALNQPSLIVLLQKLNIPKKTCDRMSKDIIETKGWTKGSHQVITLTQFVSWAEEMLEEEVAGEEKDKEDKEDK